VPDRGADFPCTAFFVIFLASPFQHTIADYLAGCFKVVIGWARTYEYRRQH
jgi:hypothetical protein